MQARKARSRIKGNMKRAIIAGLGLYLGWREFSADIGYWLPSLGVVYGGQVIGQAVVLGILAAFIFGAAVWTSYRALSYIFD